VISEQERKEIEAVILGSPTKRAACLEALQVVQSRSGWVSDEDIEALAAILGMTPDELDGVATFYNQILRKKVGRHVILVCDSISCWIMGYENILAHLKSRLGIGLGETSSDGRFTLLPSVCLGACEQAPAMIVDGELYGELTPQRVDKILERHP
jgi:NADH-quinone oxidoreductase subunit E